MSVAAAGTSCPLYVDLDGTLLATDSLWESVLLVVRRHPWKLPGILMSIRHGRAAFKQRVSELVVPSAAHLPYRSEVMDFLRQEKAAGRRLILTTGSDQRMAQAVAEHVGIFDEVMASDGVANLSGQGKLAAIRARIGDAPFGYVGNAPVDVVLWKDAAEAYVAGASGRTLALCRSVCQPKRVFEQSADVAGGILRALRPSQWAKNLLLFVPIVLAHKVLDFHRLTAVIFAFVCFSFCASAVYILNDLLDLEEDRQHPRKCRRPFAAGIVPIFTGVKMFLILLAGSFALAAISVNRRFVVLLLVYFILTTAYSLALKRRLLLDVIVLALLYTHRLIAGGAAGDVPLSFWILVFALFFFTSLAFVKRYSELTLLKGDDTRAKGRNYTTSDLGVIASVGPCSGYLAILVICLYINSDAVRPLYPHPRVLWLICPVLLHWITRIWFIAGRRSLVDDPVLFAMKDRVSWMAGALTLILLLLASSKASWTGLGL